MNTLILEHIFYEYKKADKNAFKKIAEGEFVHYEAV